MSSVRCVDLVKRFGDVVAVSDVSLEIADGEFVVLVGPSGCGKTTTLRMIAGLERISEGDIFIDDDLVNEVPPRHRNIAMVFQNYALYPHKRVFDNIGYPLKLQKVRKDDLRERVHRVADLLNIRRLLERWPKELSGGERQRVALGRAIIRDPRVFLMDEPLSNLDAQLRVQMRREIIHLQRRLKTTTIYVTHDQVEAMTMGDRIVVMSDGLIQQVGEPEAVYRTPSNTFVARFIGSPSMNLMNGILGRSEGKLELRSELRGVLPVPDGDRPAAGTGDGALGGEVEWGVRPEDLEIVSAEDPSPQVVVGDIDLVERLGSDAFAAVEVGSEVLIVRVSPDRAPREGERVGVRVNTNKLHLFSAKTGERLNVGRDPSNSPEPAGV